MTTISSEQAPRLRVEEATMSVQGRLAPNLALGATSAATPTGPSGRKKPTDEEEVSCAPFINKLFEVGTRASVTDVLYALPRPWTPPPPGPPPPTTPSTPNPSRDPSADPSLAHADYEQGNGGERLH
jgi:hypothetical protein